MLHPGDMVIETPSNFNDWMERDGEDKTQYLRRVVVPMHVECPINREDNEDLGMLGDVFDAAIEHVVQGMYMPSFWMVLSKKATIDIRIKTMTELSRKRWRFLRISSPISKAQKGKEPKFLPFCYLPITTGKT